MNVSIRRAGSGIGGKYPLAEREESVGEPRNGSDDVDGKSGVWLFLFGHSLPLMCGNVAMCVLFPNKPERPPARSA